MTAERTKSWPWLKILTLFIMAVISGKCARGACDDLPLDWESTLRQIDLTYSSNDDPCTAYPQCVASEGLTCGGELPCAQDTRIAAVCESCCAITRPLDPSTFTSVRSIK